MMTCNKCGERKPLSKFAKDANRPHGVRKCCKACAAKRQAEYNRRHKEQVALYRRRSNLKHRDRISKRNRSWGAKNRGLLMVRGAKARAKQGELPFDLDQYKNEIQQRVDAGFCELTGIPFNLNGGREWDTPSLDRIDPKKGYVYSNVRVVCRAINCMLGTWGPGIMEEVFKAYCLRK